MRDSSYWNYGDTGFFFQVNCRKYKVSIVEQRYPTWHLRVSLGSLTMEVAMCSFNSTKLDEK